MARVNIIEWIAKKLRSLTGIVEDGDTATHAISAGKYVIWKGNPCKASSAISIGDALSSSNLTALTDGVCNDIADETGAKVNKTDIVNNLTTNDSTKVLSAAQGYALNSDLQLLGTDIGVLNSKLNVVITSLGTGITKFVYGKIIIIDFQGASIPADGVDTGETIYGSFFASVSVVNSAFTLIRNLSSKIVVRNGEAATGVYGTWWGIII